MSSPFTPPNSLPAAQSAANQVVNLISATFGVRVRNFQTAYNLVWNNKNATPDQVVAAMGTQALAIFTARATEATLLNSYQPSLNLPTTIVAINPATKAVWTFTPVLDANNTPTGAVIPS